MTCIVLAAGYATRMYPLTLDFPKPLLDVGGKPILDWLCDDIASCNVENFVIISNHKFYEHFASWAKNRTNTVVLDDGSMDNDSRLGAVKDIEFAIETLKLDDDLLVIAGDNVLDFSFAPFLNYFKDKQTTCIMRYFIPNIKGPCKYGICTIGDNDKVVKMVEKPLEPESPWAVPPFYIYKKADIGLFKEGIEGGCGTDAPGSFIEWLCKQTTVHAMEMPGQRYDVGSIEGYEKIKKEYRGITRG
ncbi:MAG: nucleotidyltransferase family protein [Sphaerochaetaceae bacterium]|nr:nucleotidyltransferase family protein [Sphaerochaetaceae bacterium]